MKHITIILMFLTFSFDLSARSTLVTSASEINSGSWMAGDTILMKNGTWLNQSIILKATGKISEPIVLLAQTPGQVILTGSSKLAFSGSYMVVSGLFFKDGTLSGSEVVSFRTSSSEFANYCRLTNTAIVNYNPADKTVDSKWVSLHGEGNQVDHCSFENKTNSGTLLVVWLKSGIEPKHLIEQNYFGYRNSNLDANGSEINGQEIIRIGDSSTSMQTASVTVRDNIFEKCNGETEIISNKSCGNLYSNNVFMSCSGMLTLRHGNNCTVEGNYFFGNGVSNTGGVRIIGENHKVFNNYFEKLRGTGYRTALCIVRGKENSLLNEYFQVKNAVVAFNTFVDCYQTFNINYNSSSTCTLPPIGTVIAHNNVYNTSTNNTNVIIAQSDPTMDVTWKNNIMNLGKYSNFAPTSNQVVTGLDPLMRLAGTSTNIFEPASESILSTYATSEFPEIVTDIRGRSRSALSKWPGSSQISGETTRTMPSKTTVGASFFDNSVVAVRLTSKKPIMSAYVENNELIAQISTPGTLSLFDTTGKMISIHTVTEGMHSKTLTNKGLFIVRFETSTDGSTIQKVILQ